MSPLSYQTIAPHIPETGGTLFVAYSGGIDSHVLLHLCASQATLRDKIVAVYVHHGLQNAAEAWGEHCRRQAAALAVGFRMLRVDAGARNGESPEAAARHARYRALQTVLQAGDNLLLAQHREDQLETVLLQLFRGAGVQGLAAMPVSSPLGLGSMWRPLLHVGKAEILDYATRHGLQWVDDPSNQSSDFDRNFLRNEIVPQLRQRWPSLDKTVARSAQHCGEAALLLDNWARDVIPKLYSPQEKSLAIDKLLHFSAAQRRCLLRHWFALQALKPPSQAVLTEIDRQLITGRTNSDSQIFNQGHFLKKYRQRLFCIAAAQLQAEHQDLEWSLGMDNLPLRNGYILSLNTGSVGIDQQLWHSMKVTVKPRRGGEKIKLPGRDGRHCLKKLYQDAGIPPWERETRPLIYLDDRLAAVAGLWIAEWAWAAIADGCYQLDWQFRDSV